MYSVLYYKSDMCCKITKWCNREAINHRNCMNNYKAFNVHNKRIAQRGKCIIRVFNFCFLCFRLTCKSFIIARFIKL